MSKFIKFTSILCLISAPFTNSNASEIIADPIIVSASHTPLEGRKIGRAHTVITAEQLEKSQTRYLVDALRQVPGISVSRTGSFGGLTQVRLRGSEGNHVLVLIDGIEVSEPSQGEFDFGSLQAANVERIEIIRGPQSALWGSNATAGVINIITKKGERNAFQVNAQSELGTDRTALANIGVRGGGNKYDYALSGAFRRTDGFNISSFGNEKDGDKNLTLNGKGTIDLGRNLQLDVTARHVRRESESDDQDFAFPATPTQGLVIDTNSYTKTREYFGGLGLTSFSFDDQFIQKLQLEGTSVLRKGETDSGVSGNEGTRFHAGYQGTFELETPSFLNALHSLTGALEYERETFTNNYPSSPAQFPTQSRNLYGAAFEYRGEFSEKLFLSAAVRYDINDNFENSLTYSLSSSYVFPQFNSRLHASIGTGITNPTFYEQFGFNPGTFIGNANLKPEENFGWDIGVEQKFLSDNLVIDLTYFREHLEDEIQSQYDAGLGVSSPVNLDGTSKRQGVELSVNAQLFDNITLNGAYTYLSSKEPNGVEEVRRPRHSASLGVRYTFDEGRASLFSNAVYNGAMEDLEYVNSTPQTRVTLDDYVLVSVGADYQINETVQLYGRVENLLNSKYQEVYSFNSQGLTAFIGLRADF